MHMRGRIGLAATGALALAASFTFIDIHAALASTARAVSDASSVAAPRYCYAWPHERVQLVRPAGAVEDSDVRESNQIMVTQGSPCRDVNVRSVSTPDGVRRCAILRVRWADTGTYGAWHRVCAGWRVLAYAATEGRVFTIEAQGRTALTLVVRS